MLSRHSDSIWFELVFPAIGIIAVVVWVLFVTICAGEVIDLNKRVTTFEQKK